VRQRLEQRRLPVLIYLGVVAVVALVVVVWVLPSVLTRHPQLDDPAERHKAITDTRTGLIAMLAAIGAAGGLAFTARTYRLSREGHITDRYSKAVEQLGNEKIEVRLGGIYALERLMLDSPADQPTIMETLAAFVREHAPLSNEKVEVRLGGIYALAAFVRQRAPHRSRPALDPAPGSFPSTQDHPSEDVQAVLTVLGRRRAVHDERPIDLSRTNLPGASFFEANLTSAILFEANLTGADLSGAHLTGAFLYKANLTSAILRRANLTGAYLSEATLTNAYVAEATLTEKALTEKQWASAWAMYEITWVPPSQQTG